MEAFLAKACPEVSDESMSAPARETPDRPSKQSLRACSLVGRGPNQLNAAALSKGLQSDIITLKNGAARLPNTEYFKPDEAGYSLMSGEEHSTPRPRSEMHEQALQANSVDPSASASLPPSSVCNKPVLQPLTRRPKLDHRGLPDRLTLVRTLTPTLRM
ncbi:hypothetical protein CYMTET_21886 [Cymbomonas tetramitiformis]|uniref:Uncharacterized protein n=1 Tax=Cymbomonas tetramitiformis TaxID=36881 RepID=A0AAE0G0Y2_9CHLO|nr:hypothetical protein CYMTET_21886 [Cymbomonas tetramitiformis]